MDLSKFNFKELCENNFSVNTTPELVAEAQSRNISKGKEKFNQLFFSGGELKLQDDVKGTWKEDAYLYARKLMSSFAPKHENKQDVCAMIFEETLKL